jgi:CelD/BcsL family acetyltransferase involved in cellulose biosynthesis
VQVISKISPERWDELVGRSADSTFFQTHTWAKILEHSFGFEIATRLYLFEDGKEVLLPLMKTFTRLGVFAEYVSMPLAYGGFVSPSPPDERRVREIRRTFGPNEALFIGPHPLASAEYGAEGRKIDYYTHILWLDGGFDHVWNNKVKKKRRNRCRKSEEMGVSVVEGSSLEAFQEYSSIYRRASALRGQISHYPESLFTKMADAKCENIRLWLAKLGPQTIAGSIVFYDRQGLFNWSESTIAEYAHYHPASALVKHIIEDACSRGFKYVDFGGSMGTDGQELEGVRRHKESFGAERVNYSAFRWEGRLFRIGRQISRLTRMGAKKRGRE